MPRPYGRSFVFTDVGAWHAKPVLPELDPRHFSHPLTQAAPKSRLHLGRGLPMSAAPALDLHEAKGELVASAKKFGVLTIGVADVSAFDDQPEGQRPADLLPGAKRVIAVGGEPPRAGDWISPNYQHMETTGTSDRIGVIALRLARFIESRFGYYALYVPPGVDGGNQPFLSIMAAAEKSGCGSRSLAGPVLHPELGFMHYSAVVTTLPLPVDSPLAEPACPAPECVEMWEEKATTPCLSVCPIGEGGCLWRQARRRSHRRAPVRQSEMHVAGLYLLGSGLPEGFGIGPRRGRQREAENDPLLLVLYPHALVDDLRHE